MTHWIIKHGYYGCATGCCGVEALDELNDIREFVFSHPDADEQTEEWARKKFSCIKPDDTVSWEWEDCLS